MTDYLELLLEQAEDDWDEQPLDWRKRVQLPPAAEYSREEYAPQQTGGAAEADRVLRVKSRTGMEMVEDPEKLKTDILEQLNRLERTAARVRGGAPEVQGSRYNSGMGSAEPARVRVMAEMGVSGMPAARPARLAAALDAVFERDARRYDGPLGLL